MRLYLNFFQPVMVLVHKQRTGARVKRIYDQAKTPYQRILEAPEVAETVKQHLQQQYATLNPAALLRQIQQHLELLWQLANKPATSLVAPVDGDAEEPRFPGTPPAATVSRGRLP